MKRIKRAMLNYFLSTQIVHTINKIRRSFEELKRKGEE